MAAAYVIALRERMIDPSEIAVYAKKAMPTLANAKLLAAYGRHETLEGPPLEGAVILEFQSYEAAMTWYNSAQYQDAKKHRLAGADYRLLVVQGV
jgi:uncharacterized protein (DUF1330 family)